MVLKYEHVKWYFSFMSTFLQLERRRLGFSAAEVVNRIGGSRATYTRWESGSPIPSNKLLELNKLGFDVLYVVTGQRSQKINNTQEEINLSKEEQVLLDNFRHCSIDAKAALKATSNALTQQDFKKAVGKG